MRYLYIIFSLLVIDQLYAQDCNYSFFGEVIDLHLNEGLSGAKVTIDNNSFVVSNLKGEFSIDDICEGEHELTISHPNCKVITVKIDIPYSGVKKIYLEHHITELEEIIVSTNSNKKESLTSIEDVIDREKILDFKSKNFGDVLEQLSGVSSFKMGNNIVKPVLHGLTGSRVGIINNGIRLQDNEWGADHAPSIDLSNIDAIQLIKGVGTLRYAGDAVAGLIKTKSSRSLVIDSLYGYGSIGYTDNGKANYLISKIKKSSSNGNNLEATVSLKSNGDYESPNYFLSNTSAKKIATSVSFSKNKITKEWGARYTFFRNDIGILKSAHVGTLGDLARAINSQDPLVINPYSREIDNPKQENIHHNFSFFYKSRTTKNLKWDFQYSYQSNNRKEYDLRRGEFRDVEALNILLQTHDLLFDTFYSKNKDFVLKSGLSFQFQDNYSNPRTGIKRLIPDHNRLKFGVYGITEYNYSNDFKIEFGSRFDFDKIDAKKYYRISDWEDNNYNEDFSSTIIEETSTLKYLTRQIRNFSNFSSTFGAQKILKKGLSTTVNLSYSTRSPNASELFSDGLHHSLATIELGDLRMKQEKGLKFLVSLEKSNDILNYSLTLYNSKIKNFIILQPTVDGFDLTRRGAFLKRKYRGIPIVHMRGFDFDFGVNFSPTIVFKTSSSFLEAFEDDGTPLVDMPPFNLRNQLDFTVFKSNPLLIRLSSEFVAQQNNFPYQNFMYNFIEEGVILQKEVDISSPPSSYNLLNFELKKNFFGNLDFRIYVENVFNINYRNYLNRLRFFASEVGRISGIELNYTF